tara:strand:+ start:510 stop:872 length:363 start_codon:yes stop_codon:yes gene_type:complete
MSWSKAAYMRQYYIDHKEDYQKRYERNRKNPKFVEKRKEYSKERYHENPEEYQQYAKEYREKNKEIISKKAKAKYKETKEMKNKKQREYYQKNKVRLAENRFMRRYIDVMADFVISLEGF